MKRLTFLLIAFVCSIILGACQEKLEWTVSVDQWALDTTALKEREKEREKEQEMIPSFEELMTLSGHMNPHQQGGDCWGDYFFQFVTNNSVVRVYDLSTKTLVQTVTIGNSQRGFVSNCHCNTVCFGTEYYDVEDTFPLVYVSTGYAAGGYTGALVYRITQHNGNFFITLVQTIKFPVDKSSWTEFIPGEDGFAYLCYTSERIIFKVAMPKLGDEDVIITRDDAIETYQFTPQPDWMSTSRNQDRLYYQGKILFISGVPPGEASAFVALNLETLERETIVDFKKLGLMNESESLFVWQGDLYVAFVDKIVKLVNFINTP